MISRAPLITVVIPSFNQGRFLERTLLSVLAQDIEKEIIVIDGGSTDNSVDIIERYQGDITYWHSQSDNGQADAINQGVKKGTAPYVCWLNSDDVLLNDGLIKMYQVLEKTKTHNGLNMHYKESMQAVKRSFGYIPLKWHLAFPVMRIVRRLAALRYS